MTSTPNSSFDNIKTTHNAIGKRKSKRLSKRTPVPLIVRLFLSKSIPFLIQNSFLDDSTSYRRDSNVYSIIETLICKLILILLNVCLCVFIRNDVRYSILSIK